jgi:hypothetical protein
MKTNLSLFSVGKMKRLVNSRKNFVLMIVKDKYVDKSDAFQGCDPSRKNELDKFIVKYEEIFKKPKGLSPKREIQNEIQLKQDVPLFLILLCT